MLECCTRGGQEVLAACPLADLPHRFFGPPKVVDLSCPIASRTKNVLRIMMGSFEAVLADRGGAPVSRYVRVRIRITRYGSTGMYVQVAGGREGGREGRRGIVLRFSARSSLPPLWNVRDKK